MSIKKTIINAGVFAIALVSITLGFSQKALSAHLTQSTVMCSPANLDQALNGPLQWSHMRVWNDSDTPIWVTCAVTNELDLDSGGQSLGVNGAFLSVNAWFGTGSAGNAEVMCIFREVQGSGSGTSGNSASLTIKANGTLPDVAGKGITATGFANGVLPITAACKLDPNTGIQSISQLLKVQ